jgi:uncharacterized metal-binding protein
MQTHKTRSPAQADKQRPPPRKQEAEETSHSLTSFICSGRANHGKQMMSQTKAIGRAQQQKTEAEATAAASALVNQLLEQLRM